MVTEADVDSVSRQVFAYMNSHPGIMVSFDNGFIKTGGETYKKVFWVSVGKEPWPWEMLAVRAKTQSDTPQEAFDKAIALAVSRLTRHQPDAAEGKQVGDQALPAARVMPISWANTREKYQ